MKGNQIANFSQGISDDVRSSRGWAMIKHFEIFSNPQRLTPFRSSEADHATNVSSTAAKAFNILHFQHATTGLLYGLGVNGSGYPKVLRKADPTTGNWLASDGSNAATAIGEGNAARITGSFIEHALNFWGFQGTNQIWKVLISTGVITNSVATVGSTITSVAQSVFGADGNLYMFYNNQVVRVSPAGAVTDAVLTCLPADMRITSVARWGSYLAIGMAYGTSNTAPPTGRSQVYLWDYVTTTTVYDVIQWGEGTLTVLGNVEENLIGVTNKYLETPSGLTSLALGNGSMVIRQWNGGVPRIVKEVVGNQVVTLGRFIKDVVIKDNKMHWVASIPMNQSSATESTYHLGIWAYGRKNASSDYALSLAYIEEGVDSANFKINSFGNAGNYWFINHSADGSIAKTDDAANYTFTSIGETNIINDGDPSQLKKLDKVWVTTNFLPTAGQVVLKYRADAETSYTTIYTNTTDNSITHSATNIESTGVNLPDFNEIQFRVESTGGAEITGLKYLAHVIPNNPTVANG